MNDNIAMLSPKLEVAIAALAGAAKRAGSVLAIANQDVKKRALIEAADELQRSRAEIIAANIRDTDAARVNGLSEQKIERLTLNDKRIDDMRSGLVSVASLPDPVGKIDSGWVRPNGLQITRVRVPLGLIGIIYESRPNVTIDAASLCIKSGNAVILRGGSEAIHSNTALVACLKKALTTVGLPSEAVTFVESTDRSVVQEMIKLNGVIDCLIPRGGASLIQTVIANSSIPVIETGTGNCHIYVDREADCEMAVKIIINAKTQRTSVCNSAESLLIHRDIAARFIPLIGDALQHSEVEIVGDETTTNLLPYAKKAIEDDWYEEYLALKISIKVVENVEEASAHINKYSSHHSDAIVTEDYGTAEYFLNAVDSAAVYVNASTRFTDGYEFGFGAEIGISNQKLHARGPMGLDELTTYKYVVRGNGQIRE